MTLPDDMRRTAPPEVSTSVLIYVETSKQVGDPDHLKVFANVDAAKAWFAENNSEGVASE